MSVGSLFAVMDDVAAENRGASEEERYNRRNWLRLEEVLDNTRRERHEEARRLRSVERCINYLIVAVVTLGVSGIVLALGRL